MVSNTSAGRLQAIRTLHPVHLCVQDPAHARRLMLSVCPAHLLVHGLRVMLKSRPNHRACHGCPWNGDELALCRRSELWKLAPEGRKPPKFTMPGIEGWQQMDSCLAAPVPVAISPFRI